MTSSKKYSGLTEEQLLAKQRAGAKITATIVGVIALAIFIFTLYMQGR